MKKLTFLKRLAAIVRVEFLNEFSSPISLVFFFLLPLLFTAAVGAGLSGMMDGGAGPVEEIRIPIYVLVDDDGPLAEVLIDALRTGDLQPEVVDVLPDEAYGLEIPADFSEMLFAGGVPKLVLHTLPNNSASPAVEQAVLAARGRVGGAALVAKMGAERAREDMVTTTDEEASAFFVGVLNETLAASDEPPAVPEVRWPEGVAISEGREMATSAEQASAGQLVTWVQITLLGAAEVLVAERLRGTLGRMLAMPASRTTILGGKLFARLILGLVQMTLLFATGVLFFRVGWGRQPAAVALVSLTFALATVSLGILLATFVKTQGQAGSIVIVMSMGMAALGGAWFPLEVTPSLFRRVVQILPSTWAMRAYTDILVRNAGVIAVLPYVGVLCCFAVVFVVVGMWRFSRGA